MTKKELIEALIESPHDENIEVSVYPIENLDTEDLNIIDSLDTTMDNRLELNVKKF